MSQKIQKLFLEESLNKEEIIMCLLTQLKLMFLNNGMQTATEIARILGSLVDHHDKNGVDVLEKNDYIDLLISVLQEHKNTDN